MDAQDNLVNAVKTGDIDGSVEITKKLLTDGVSADEILNTVTGAMKEVGDAFEKFEIFLPEMMLAADTMIEILRVPVKTIDCLRCHFAVQFPVHCNC